MQALSLCQPLSVRTDARKGRVVAGKVAVRRQGTLCKYKVTLQDSEGKLTKELEVDPGTYILDAAEVAGVDLPYTCRAGACSSCCARITKGDVTQDLVDGQLRKFLDDAHQEEGFIMICVALAKADCTIITHQEEHLY